LDEPLDLIAPLAAEIAAAQCREDDSPQGSCAWYHGTVGYLRLLGVISSPAEDSGFLVPTFEKAARSGATRVLISGAGDCSMLAQVLGGFQAAGVRPDITLIDRCATPVRLNEWFAARHDLTIGSAVSNVTDFDSRQPFDLICTHCFLGYFTREERPALLDKWFALLRPGGLVVTVNPIRAVASHDFVGFSAEQAAAFEARARAAAESSPGAVDCDPTSLGRRVKAFTASFGSYPVRSAGELKGLFTATGFTVELCRPLNEAASGGGGPTEKSLIYQAIVARRP
jgi:SAM-dependent methyltransferase